MSPTCGRCQVCIPWARFIRDRDIHHSRKEVSFAAYSINRRLSARDENTSLGADADAPPCLRRKSEQGKGRQWLVPR